MKPHLIIFFCLCSLSLLAQDLPKVVVLHPLLAEMTRDLMGDTVQVVNILPTNSNLHSFEPTPKDLVDMQDAVLLIAMGKHLETYLDRLRENLPETVAIYEAGRLVPSLKSDPDNAVFACCPEHGLAAIDPHWWQNPLAVRRAVRHLGRELEKKFPAEKESIRARTTEKMDSLEALDRWITQTLSVIPAADRKLVTTHNAFGYFCAQYKFQAVPVRGTNNERDPSTEELAATMEILKTEKVKALFPEGNSSADFLRAVHEASGIPLTAPLNAGFVLQPDETYESVFKQNVEVILSALGGAFGGESTP